MSANTIIQNNAISAGDQFVMFAAGSSDWRTVADSILLAWIKANAASASPVQQSFTPGATGFSLAIADALTNIWVIIKPLAAYAAGTLVLPATPYDRQSVEANSTQAITALTINPNGKTLLGGPTTLAANGVFRVRYDAATLTWYRVA